MSDVLKHPIRRRIILTLYDRKRMSYVDLMNRVKVVSTGKFNYHLKILGDLIEKDQDGKYGLTEKGQMVAQLVQKFPERNSEKESKFLKIGYNLSIFAGIFVIVTEVIRVIIFQFSNPSCICFPEPLSRVNLQSGSLILSLIAFIFGPTQIICGILTKRRLFIILPLTLLSSLPLFFTAIP
ncbi:MAG: winged helix-turn-helix domain-containing protein [Thermoproteota archaeon]|nr:winged helix-turn-helix domain-containing protein [Thermoproteota archaeon]